MSNQSTPVNGTNNSQKRPLDDKEAVFNKKTCINGIESKSNS